MTFRPPNIPAGLSTKDAKTQEDLRRLRDVLRNLSAQMEDLQAQIDAAGGGGGTPDPHATTHENAGSDEIDVAGLSGELADPQRADTIVETSGPTDLTVGAIVDGEALVRSGSTIVSTSLATLDYATPEIWSIPATPNAEDLEFDSSSLPSGFTLFALTASTATPVAPISGVDYLTQPAAGNVRIEANKANKRSWLLMQPRGEAQRWFYAKKITLSGTVGWVFRSRICTHTGIGNSATDNASSIGMTLYKDDGSGTKPAIVAAATAYGQNGISVGWEGDANTMSIQAYAVLTSVVTDLRTLVDMDAGTSVPHEVCLVLTAGAASNTWYVFLRGPNYTYLLATGTAANTGIKQGDVVWIGYEFIGVNSTIPASPVLSSDYLRFEDTAANFIP